jgi:hypothetical protein
VLVEEKYTRTIIDQMYRNIELARHVGQGTDEQKIAIESSNQAIEHVNGMLGVMVDEVQRIAETSNNIYESAMKVLRKTQDS